MFSLPKTLLLFSSSELAMGFAVFLGMLPPRPYYVGLEGKHQHWSFPGVL